MPLWLQILCIVLGGCGLMIICHIIYLFFTCAHVIRDNIVFKNKYQYKIYKRKERLKRYEEKIKDQISFLESKSIYCENIKILHEKRIDSAFFLTSDEFMKINKKKGK